MIVFDKIITTLQNTGGASILFNELISRLHRDSEAFQEYGYQEKEENRPNYIKIKKRALERYRDFPTKILSSGDIFHSTCYRIPDTKGRLKTVTTVHDFTYEEVIGGLPRAVHSWQKNRAIHASDSIICVSNNTRLDLEKYLPSVRGKRIHVIHNGVADFYRPIADVKKLEYLLFVGQRGGYKNFQALIKAVQPMNEISIRCVGGGDFTKKEKEMLAASIPGRYSHLGYLSNEALNLAYNQALALVYPSVYEGFGIPVVEAMRAGCPVVAVNCSSIPEVAGNAAILCDSGDPSALREGIKNVLSNSVRTSLIERGILQAQRFSWERCYQETLKVYQSLT